MNILRNEKGFALGFVLILAAIALTITLAMLLMVSRGSYISGQQMRFRNALEASKGGMEAMFQAISFRGNLQPIYVNQALNPSLVPKISNPTDNWATGLDNSITIDPTNSTTYDMQIDLGAYTAYAKIVDTVNGNSGADEGLLKSAVVNSGSGEVTVISVPYLYTIEVLAQSRTNATERAKISVLYQY